MVKIGDLVKITKSTENWAPPMDKHIGKVVEVTHVSYNKKGCHIRFKDDNTFHWTDYDGHFIVVTNKILELW